MVYVCLTADYEVCLGENFYGIDDVLLNPSKIISTAFEKINIPITFFVDVLYADYLKRTQQKEDYQKLKENVTYLFDKGNDMQLHIHPSWLYSHQEGRKIQFDPKYYRLPEYDNIFDIGTIEKIIYESIDILKRELLPEFPKYKPIAFRAGGWCIQPEETIIKVLKANGIKIDSSVYKFAHSVYKSHQFMDYRDAPNTDCWIFDKRIMCPSTISYTEGMLEFPVYTTRSTYAYFSKYRGIIKRKLLNCNKAYEPKGRGCFVSSKSMLDRIKIFFCEPIRFSLDTLDIIDFYIKHIMQLSNDQNDHFVCFYFHPKLFDISKIDNICSAFQTLSQNKNNISFITMSEVDNLFKKKEKKYD